MDRKMQNFQGSTKLEVPVRDDDEFTAGEFSDAEEPEYNEKEAIKSSRDFFKRNPKWRKLRDQAQG